MNDRDAFTKLIGQVDTLVASGDRQGARAALLKTPFKAQPGWHHVLSRLSLDVDDVDAAVHHAVKAVALAPSNPHYRAQLAAALYVAAGRVPEALDVAEMEAERALSIDPATPTAENTLGLVRLAQGRKDEARTYFQRALDKRPNDPAAAHNLSLCAA